MARQSLGELLADLPKKIKTIDKVALLRTQPAKPLFYLLSLAFREGIEWAVPEGMPPNVKPFEGRRGAAPSELERELRHMYLFLKGGEPGLKQLRRELLFANMLNELSLTDAEILVAIKDKTFEKKYRCPRKVVDEAFPGLLTHPTFNLRFIRR